MNNVVLVGRITEKPTKTIVKDKEILSLNIAVTRNYKNSDGIYETDFVRCILWNEIATNVLDYCKVGDVIGVKGRLETFCYGCCCR